MNNVRTYFIIILNSLVLFLSSDYFFGAKLFNFDPVNLNQDFRLQHKIFSHTLKPDYEGTAAWGNQLYKVCTNSLGFKSYCGDTSKLNTEYDLVFIGDSFTEAIGMNFEDSFVGFISQSFSELTVGNMGVSSYSPSIYLAKVKHYLNKGLSMKHLIVYIDISDVQDEVTRVFENDIVKNESLITSDKPNLSEEFNLLSLKKFLYEHLPASYFLLKTLRNFILSKFDPESYHFDYERSSWTFNADSKGYGEIGVNGAVERAITNMQILSNFLNERNIQLSIAVYPWPGQLLHETGESLQVRIWRDFCIKRCAMFIESFTSFNKVKNQLSARKTIENYFFKGDIHFNQDGNKVLAQDFINSFKEYQKGI